MGNPGLPLFIDTYLVLVSISMQVCFAVKSE